ncbi:MAG TPA: DUF547 domain-containing protein [Stellaceae bacterium]|nr:DUF547 domain-containing protein [Stellaceae bacterium]
MAREAVKIGARALLALALAIAVSSCTALESLAAPESKLVSPHWLQNEPASTRRVDHDAWTRLLTRYVVPGPDGVNRVAYGRVDASDRALLQSYIGALESVAVSRLNRAEQRAYWINLYNALTLRVVLDHYPVTSIRDIHLGPGWFDVGPWQAKLVRVEGEPLSLDDIEHGILRPIWRDPRLHYALNCASLGCPKLQPVAFTAETAERLLEEGARAYVNSPRGARIDGGHLVVSSIYRWYRSDFGTNDASVMDHLRRYATPALAAGLTRFRAPDDDEYDWRLIDSNRP